MWSEYAVHVGTKTKRCTQCGEAKPVEEFRIKILAKGVRIALCTPCDIAYRAARYKRADKALAKERREEHLERRRKRVASGDLKEPKTKACITCGERKLVSNFRWRDESLAYRVNKCSACDKENRLQVYQKKKGLFLANNKRAQAKLRKLLNELKAGPCMDCHNNYPPYVMDLDHRDPATKVAKVSSLVFDGSRNLLIAEVAKCDLICANCHRIRTYNRSLKLK